jgi:hypothetical protein
MAAGFDTRRMGHLLHADERPQALLPVAPIRQDRVLIATVRAFNLRILWKPEDAFPKS